MDPVTREKLAGNAFRTLGLSASAGQSVIAAAARRMRIWPDASRVPPTAWDLPELGPLRRSKPDIEQAVSLLNEPATRLEHRLLWFAGEQPPVAGTAGNGSIAQRHAAAISGLQSAWQNLRPDDDGTRWTPVVKNVVDVCQLPEMIDWIRTTEQTGRFDKPVSDEEMLAAIGELPMAVAAGLVRQAMTALDTGRLDVVVAIANAARQVPAPTRGPADELLDRTEDFFYARCDEIEKELRPSLKTNRANPMPFFNANAALASKAAAVCDQKVWPVVNALHKLSSGDSDRRARIRSRCGELMSLLALAYEWAGKYAVAERTLVRALEVAKGTVTELQLGKDLERVKQLAALQRWTAENPGQMPPTRMPRQLVSNGLNYGSMPKVKIKTGNNATRGWLGGGGFAFFLLLRALIAGAGFSSHSSSSTDSQPVIPNFPMPHHTTPSASPMPGAPATPNFPTGSGFPAMPTPHHVSTPPIFAPEFPSPPVYHPAPFTPNIPSPMPGGGSPRGR